MKVLLIQPKFPATFWSFKHALQFVSKKVSAPPLGLITIAAMLPPEWECRLTDLNIRSLDPEDLAWSDLVFITAMNIQRDSAQEIIQLAKNSGKTIVAGGPMFTAEHENFPEVDYFILNEGEITLPRFLSDFGKGKPDHVYSTEAFADITETPIPRWDLLDISRYDSMNVQFSRGCPFNCDFCNVTALLGHRPRTKTVNQLIAELDSLYAIGWRRNIFLVDDNFIGNKAILKKELLPALIKWREGKKGFLFITEVSINLADDPELVDLMVKAGFISVFVGIETPDEESLAACNKKQNQNRDLLASVHYLQKSGLQVMAGFIVGFDSDTPSIFDRQIKFIQQSGIVTAMVGLLQAPFGTDLYRRMKQEGRLTNEMSGNNVDGSTNIIPKMAKEDLLKGYKKIIDTIFSPVEFYQRIQTFLTNYNPLQATGKIDFNEIAAFFRTIWYIGILSPARKHYWKLFSWTLINRPQLFPVAITLTVYGYHFDKIKSGITA